METLQKPRAGKRRKVLKDETPPDTPPPGAGHNAPDDATILVYVGVYRRRLAVKKAADKELGRVRKLMKNEGLVMKELDWAIKAMDDDPEVLAAELERRKRYATALNIPIGKQYDMFEPSVTILSFSELQDKAHKSGRARGLLGENPDDQAYPLGHEHHTAHHEGWHAGQAELLVKIKPIEMSLNTDTEAAAAKAAARKPAKDSLDDDMDEAA